MIIRAHGLTVPHVVHGFFTRQGGVSNGIYASLNCGPGSDDLPQHVAENRRVAMDLLGMPESMLCTVHQVHGDDVVFVTKPWTAGSRPKADAMVTRAPGVALGVLAADCAPVLFADPVARVVGACHAGWQGAFKGVAQATVQAMVRLGSRPAAIRAAIGPCIAQQSYEVGPEFRARFVLKYDAFQHFFSPSPKPGHFLFDLPGFIEARLAEAGVGTIERLGIDTYSDADRFFSYRRTTHRGEPDYGRQLSAIALVGRGPA
ncbi:peptidoglycan editing factor PgeF [Emcibacter sp. SYSU 3D8]|uniref:peptidoglycan editing factor PgeF n=1 Tax=Emcibacter sp. SYSU 3D8 TaxID=3133969 RepID=UPI0031FE907C